MSCIKSYINCNFRKVMMQNLNELRRQSFQLRDVPSRRCEL